MSEFKPGTLIKAGRFGAATICSGEVVPSLQTASQSIGVLTPSMVGIVLAKIDEQQVLVVVGTCVGVVLIAEITIA